ncbi:radical SAM protein [Candidatus Gracilibacteria bacterium]|nr:radical SAM protein [Candidatus Gracilibacteria bacterium]NUJ98860.1 radical SAM protein [Candidatus Gracilibacteria bacterium]
MEINLNKLAFICLHTSGGNIYPPQDIARNISKSIVSKNWKNYIENDYFIHKKLGFYLHTPFCESKCLFCSCGSEKVVGGTTLDIYISRIIKEFTYFSAIFSNIKLNHAYFGGGTPSIYNTEQLKKILSSIRKLYSFEEKAQWNFEISPHTMTEEKVKILKNYGVSRVTIGIQTMTLESLRVNGRFQTWDKLENIFSWIRKYGIENINIDLMPGIPGENLKNFLLNLRRIIQMNPDMIHLYPFRPSEDTLFYKKGFIYTENDIKNRDLMYELGVKLIEKYGYYGVENDSWGKNDSARNEQEVDKIINNCSILGFGYPTRSYIHKNLMYFTGYDMYNESNTVYMGIKLETKDYISRYIISHFRDGFDIKILNEKFGIDFLELYKFEIKFLEVNNILEIRGNYFKTKINNVFEKLLFSKIFYSEENIKVILDKFSYNEDKDYVKEFKDTLSIVYK